METVLIVVHLMVVIALVGVVLIQKSEGGGLGIGGGGGFMSSRGTANVLTRSTAILAAIFFATSLLLTFLAGSHREPRSVLDRQQGGTTTPAQAPAGAGGQGILDQLRPQAPTPPGGPAPPQSR